MAEGGNAVVLLSGGMDSATLLWHLRAAGYGLVALVVDYGQRHARETRAAVRLAGRAGVRPQLVNVGGLAVLLPGSSLTDALVPVPHGHYADASMRATVVPGRNLLFLALAAAFAAARRDDAVAYAAHAGDHAIYPDCRPEFVAAVAHTLAVADYRPLALLTPFLGWTKADICARGAALGVPFDLTWTCYEGGAAHCGQCGACVERREAFALAHVPDPTAYVHD